MAIGAIYTTVVFLFEIAKRTTRFPVIATSHQAGQICDVVRNTGQQQTFQRRSGSSAKRDLMGQAGVVTADKLSQELSIAERPVLRIRHLPRMADVHHQVLFLVDGLAMVTQNVMKRPLIPPPGIEIEL